MVGRYQVRGELARGGMGVVYLARDTAFGRDVAIKVLHELLRAEPRAAARFLAEACITGQLQHPAIPPVFEMGELADRSPYLVMKLIKGNTLEELLKERPDPSHGRSRFLATFEQACQAVGYAHAHGVIHRDLKPANVMVGAFGEVQVMDWGLAKVLPDDPEEPGEEPEGEAETRIRTPLIDADATRAGALMGTPAFMPPEQANGQIRRIDRRSDVFALGGVLCCVLTGRPPYGGNRTDTLQQAELGLTGDAFQRLDECGADPDLVGIAKRCLARNPADRPADASEVAALVAGYRAGVETRLRAAERERAAAEVEAREARKRRRVLAAAGVVVVAATAAAAAVSLWQAGVARAEADNARKAGHAAVAAGKDSDDIAAVLGEVLNFASSRGHGKEPVRDPTVKQALAKAESLVRNQFAGRPQAEARLRKILADAYHGLRDFEGALPHLRRRLEIQRAELGDDNEATLADMNNLGQVLMQLGASHYPEAEELLTTALARKRARLGGENLSTIKGMNNLAGLYRKQARAELGLYAADPSPAGLAHVGRALGRRDAAEPLQWEAYRTSRRVLPPDHDEILKTTNGMGSQRYDQGRFAEAERFFREAAEGYERSVGMKFPTAQCRKNVADSLAMQGGYAEAAAEYRKALAVLDQIPADEEKGLRAKIAEQLAKLPPGAGP
jgi:tetratricopeptide (TPR) repeat protein